MVDIECIFCHSIIPSNNLSTHADRAPPENNVSGFESVLDQVNDQSETSSSKTPQFRSFTNVQPIHMEEEGKDKKGKFYPNLSTL